MMTGRRCHGCGWDSLEPTDVRSDLEATRLRKRLDEERRNELLDGVMAIIAERGFSQVTIAEVARELHCSAATLYKIAPSKDSLVLLAIARWADVVFPDIEARSDKGKTASDRARVYFRVGADAHAPAVADVLRGHGALRVHAPRLVDGGRRALHRPLRGTGPAVRRRPVRSGRSTAVFSQRCSDRSGRHAQRRGTSRQRAHARAGGPRDRLAHLGGAPSLRPCRRAARSPGAATVRP